MAISGGDSGLPEMIQCLESTLSPEKDKRLEGERLLKQAERSAYFGLRLLQIIEGNGQVPQTTRLAAAVALKNYCRKYWPTGLDSTEDFEVPEEDKNTLKANLVPLMFRCPAFVQKVIGETINVIAWTDFPMKWPQLLPDLTSRFVSNDIEAILGALRTAHGLFKHYRDAFQSDGLWREIKIVLDQFAVPFTELFVATWNRIGGLEQEARESADRARAKEALENAFQILLMCCKIYYSLIFQELPQVFVDHLTDWMKKFHILLGYNNPDLQSDNDEEPGILSNIKSQICAILTLLAFKYDEDFESHMSLFVEAVWKLMLGVTQLMQDDLLAFNAMEFLSKALAQNKCKPLFEGEGILENICQNIIVPNIQFRQSDTEIFEDNPDEFIRRDIEGSDIHTRRRAAADMVRAAARFFETRVTQVLTRYIQFLIEEFQKDPIKKWKEKDSAIFLTSALAAKGATARHGAVTINEQVPVVAFATSHVIPHLVTDAVPGNKHQAVLEADCLKFIVTFRAHFPRATLIECFPALVRKLESPNAVVHTYAAHCIERIFTTRDLTTGAFALTPADIQPHLGDLLTKLFTARRIATSEKENPGGVLEENEYTMKCIMRSLSYLQDQMLPYINDVVGGLLSRLEFAVKNPGQPKYDHYLFESIALCISISCKANKQAVELFEKALFPRIEVVLKDNVDAFFPYVFQILAQLLEYRSGTQIPPEYMALLSCLLTPALLELEGSVSSVVRLLGAFFEANAGQMTDALPTIMGMAQRLIKSKKYDHEGFNLLRPAIDKIPTAQLQPFLGGIFTTFFQRLSQAKTEKFVKNLVPFLCFCLLRHGADTVIAAVETIQPGIFGMLIENVLLNEMTKIQKTAARRLCFVGGAVLLTESNQLLSGPYDRLWNSLLEKLVRLVELPPENEVVEDLHMFDLSNDEIGTGGALPLHATNQNQLIFARKPERDPTADKGDAKILLARQLATLSAARPGQVTTKIQQSIPDVRNCIAAYCQAAGVAL